MMLLLNKTFWLSLLLVTGAQAKQKVVTEESVAAGTNDCPNVDAYTAQIADLQAKVEKLSSSVDTCESQAAADRLAAEDKIAATVAELETTQATLEEMTVAQAASVKRATHLEQALIDAEVAASTSRQESIDAAVERAQAEASAKLTKVQARNKELLGQIDTLEAAVEDLKDKLSSTKSTLMDARGDLRAARERIRELEGVTAWSLLAADANEAYQSVKGHVTTAYISVEPLVKKFVKFMYPILTEAWRMVGRGLAMAKKALFQAWDWLSPRLQQAWAVVKRKMMALWAETAGKRAKITTTISTNYQNHVEPIVTPALEAMFSAKVAVMKQLEGPFEVIAKGHERLAAAVGETSEVLLAFFQVQSAPESVIQVTKYAVAHPSDVVLYIEAGLATLFVIMLTRWALSGSSKSRHSHIALSKAGRKSASRQVY